LKPSWEDWNRDSKPLPLTLFNEAQCFESGFSIRKNKKTSIRSWNQSKVGVENVESPKECPTIWMKLDRCNIDYG